MKIGKFDILKTNKLFANSIKIGSDTDLYITPRNKMSIQSNTSEIKSSENFLIFVGNEGEAGFGISIDKEQAQIGYGTKEDFQNHQLSQALTVTQSGTNSNTDNNTSDNSELQKTVEELNNTIKEQKQEIDSLNEEVTKFTNELAILQKTLHDLDMEVTLMRDYGDEIYNINTKIKQLTDKIDKLENNNSNNNGGKVPEIDTDEPDIEI